MILGDFVEHQGGQSCSVTEFEGDAQIFNVGQMFLDRFNLDAYSLQHKMNLYYPFAIQKEWKLAKYLLCSSLSMAQIDKFLNLDTVSL